MVSFCAFLLSSGRLSCRLATSAALLASLASVSRSCSGTNRARIPCQRRDRIDTEECQKNKEKAGCFRSFAFKGHVDTPRQLTASWSRRNGINGSADSAVEPKRATGMDSSPRRPHSRRLPPPLRLGSRVRRLTADPRCRVKSSGALSVYLAATPLVQFVVLRRQLDRDPRGGYFAMIFACPLTDTLAPTSISTVVISTVDRRMTSKAPEESAIRLSFCR